MKTVEAEVRRGRHEEHQGGHAAGVEEARPAQPRPWGVEAPADPPAPSLFQHSPALVGDLQWNECEQNF